MVLDGHTTTHGNRIDRPHPPHRPAGRALRARLADRREGPSGAVPRLRSTAPKALASAVGGRGAIVIRRARPTDGFALRNLAQLADRPAPSGDVILAEADGELVAAGGARGGPPVPRPVVGGRGRGAAFQGRARPP